MKKFVLAFIAAVFCMSLMAQNGASLKLNLEKNKVYRFRYSADQTSTQTINGNQQSSDTKIENTISIKMLDATADFIITEVRLDSTLINSNAMGKTSVISSAKEGDMASKEATDVMNCIENRLSKNAIYVKMDYTGKVIEIVNQKMLSDVILKDTGSIVLTGVIRTTTKKQIENMLDVKALTTQIEGMTYRLPGKPVAAGDKWTITTSTNAGGMNLDVITEYHIDGINGNIANLTTTSEIKPSANAAPIISGPAKVTYDNLKGVVKSTMQLDIKTGLATEDKGKSHIAGTLGISGPGFNMEMPMDINGDSKVVLVK